MEEKDNGDVFWNKYLNKPLGENKISINDAEYNINHNIEAYFTNTKSMTRNMDNEDKLSIFNILENVGFHDNLNKNSLKSVGMKDALYNLPKAIARVRILLLPAIEEIDDSYKDLSDKVEGEGVKIIIPANIIEFYTRLKDLLGNKFSGHSDTLTEASNLIHELHDKREIHNKQQCRIALDKFQLN